MYADDSTVCAAASSVGELNNILQKELTLVLELVTSNKLVLNVEKMKSIIIGSKYQLNDEPTLKLNMNSIPVEQVQETNLLGIMTDNKLLWPKHIDNIVCKMGKAVSVVRRASKVLSPHVVRQVLSALVLSQLDYCFVIWSKINK